MAASTIPPIRLGLIGTGFAVEKIPVPPEPNDIWLSGTEGVLVQGALDSAEQAAVLALDPGPGAGLVPLWRSRGSTELFDGLPGQRISSSASFAA